MTPLLVQIVWKNLLVVLGLKKYVDTYYCSYILSGNEIANDEDEEDATEDHNIPWADKVPLAKNS